jgi:hypothetical protein
VVIRRGGEARCVRLAFQIAPDADLAEFEKGINSHGLKTARKRDPEPGIAEIVTFEDPKGTVLEVVRERALPKSAGPSKGISPFKLGHVAFNCVDVKDHQLLLRRARLSGVRLVRRNFLVPALRA